MFLHFTSLFLEALGTLKTVIQRNSLIVKAVTLAFFIIMAIAVAITAFALYASPEVTELLTSVTHSAFNYEDVPTPFTGELFSYIFLNNIGHFWNPVKLLVWVPLIGPLLLALELPLNSGVIGVVAVMVGANEGLVYPILGLVPHGIIEIPAFLLQFSAIVLWQVTITEAAVAKLRGEPVKKDKLKKGLKDVLVLAVTSILFLLIAAAVETYVTPRHLGL